MRKKLLASALLVVSAATTSFAQFNAGGGLAINRYGGGYGKTHPAFQLRAGFDFKEGRYFFNAGINYSSTKGKRDFSTLAYNGNASTEIQVTQAVSINNVFFRTGRTFGASENDFHFKLFSGVSFDLISVKYGMGKVPSGYEVKESYKEESATGPKIDMGLGGDYTIGTGKLFFEMMAGLAANTVNGQAFDNPTVGHVGFAFGYKFYFGGVKRYY